MNLPVKHVVLLGIGHTNAHVVREWASDPIPGCTLTCISKFPTATYSGMLPGTLSGQFGDDEMRIDLRELTSRAGATLILADTCGLDLKTGEIRFSDHDPVSFDLLSVGVGSMPAGWQEHAESPLMVPIKPMQTFLARLDQNLRGTDRPRRISIVGGGVAGVEIACCLQRQLRERERDGETTIEIFTSSDRIADGTSERSIRRIKEILALRKISVHVGHRVTAVGETKIMLDDGQEHPADCVIWATGAVAPPVLGLLGLQTDERGFIATNNRLQSLTDSRVFAVGDSGTDINMPSPKAGVYAVRQSPILWHNLRTSVVGGVMKSFSPQSDFLKILNTGDGKALLQYGWFTAHARWCWKLKTWIDKRFVREFKTSRKRNRNVKRS